MPALVVSLLVMPVCLYLARPRRVARQRPALGGDLPAGGSDPGPVQQRQEFQPGSASLGYRHRLLGGCGPYRRVPGHPGMGDNAIPAARRAGGHRPRHISRPRSCSALSVRELNADAHHFYPRRRCHGARLGRARPRGHRHPARAGITRADRASATPNSQDDPAFGRGVCPQARSDRDPDKQRGGTEPCNTRPRSPSGLRHTPA
jgi:hypothetical protein